MDHWLKMTADAAGTVAQAGPNHRSTLDGLRAVAIIVVLLFHAGTPGFRSGWIGVDLFFALSGFLITTLLLMESSATGRIDFGSFMARRLLRLMPAYFLYAAFVTALIWCWHGSVRSSNGGWTAGGLTAAVWGYFVNFVPQGGVWNGQDLTIHLWSLSVEQQYYLFWPALVLVTHRFPRRLGKFAAMLAAASLLAFCLTPVGLYRDSMLFTRGFSLIMASAFAILVFKKSPKLSLDRSWRVLGGPGVLTLAAIFLFPYREGWDVERVRSWFIPLLVPFFILFIARLWHLERVSLIRTILTWRPLIYIGKISYGIYLYHEAVRVATWYVMKPAMADWSSGLGFVTRLGVYFVLSFALAALSYEFFERRFLNLAYRFRSNRFSLPA